MKKRTIIIIVIGGLVLIAALWGASRHFGWFEGEVSEQEPVDTFVYDENVPVDLENKTKVLDLVVLDMSGSMIPLCTSVVDGFPSKRMFQSWFVVSDLQSDTYYYHDL